MADDNAAGYSNENTSVDPHHADNLITETTVAILSYNVGRVGSDGPPAAKGQVLNVWMTRTLFLKMFHKAINYFQNSLRWRVCHSLSLSFSLLIVAPARYSLLLRLLRLLLHRPHHHHHNHHEFDITTIYIIICINIIIIRLFIILATSAR